MSNSDFIQSYIQPRNVISNSCIPTICYKRCYGVLIFINLILSNVFEDLEKDCKAMFDNIDTEYHVELSRKQHTEGFYLQYAFKGEQILFDTVITSILKFWRDIENKSMSLCIINKDTFTFSKYEDRIKLLDLIAQQNTKEENELPNGVFIIKNINNMPESELFAITKERFELWEQKCEIFIYEPGSLLNDTIVLTKLFESKNQNTAEFKTILVYIAW